MLRARRAVQNLQEYRPPLGNRLGLRMDFNENTAGASPRVLQCLRELTLEQLARYPEREAVEVTLADFFRVQGRQLLLTNGVDESIHLICETYLEPNDQAVIVVPTFGIYELFVGATGAQPVPVLAKQDFGFPTEDVLANLNDRTRLVVIANPNNPTGQVASRADLLQVAYAAPQAAILIDEAYFEFYGETLLDQIGRLPNLFIARTFSKAYGLAGLRIGVLVGPAEQISAVRRVASPYNVNAVALACLPAALHDQSFVQRYVDEVRQGRKRLQDELRSLGIRHWPSHANFVLANLGREHRAFVDEMRRRGVLVRDRSQDPGCEGCVRITVGAAKQMDQVLAAIRETVAEIGSVKGVPA
jgi:histidinol-phosphate aminotransferase